MLFEMLREQIERGVDIGFIVEARSLSANELQPMLPLPVVGQQAVDVAARHPAIAASISGLMSGQISDQIL